VEPKRTKLGQHLGLLFCLGGFVLVWVGWNGAASYDDSSRQFPYLISGGIAGLCMINIGVGLWIVQAQRSERARLEDNLLGLERVLETLVEVTGLAVSANGSAAGVAGTTGSVAAAGGLVLAGTTAYHRPACHLVQDHPRLRTMTADMAAESGLAPCRTCAPEEAAIQLPG
jgi:hypothetical protein